MNDDHLVNENITNEYLRMLEHICDDVYYLPSDFEEFGIGGKTRFESVACVHFYHTN